MTFLVTFFTAWHASDCVCAPYELKQCPVITNWNTHCRPDAILVTEMPTEMAKNHQMSTLDIKK